MPGTIERMTQSTLTALTNEEVQADELFELVEGEAGLHLFVGQGGERRLRHGPMVPSVEHSVQQYRQQLCNLSNIGALRGRS